MPQHVVVDMRHCKSCERTNARYHAKKGGIYNYGIYLYIVGQAHKTILTLSGKDAVVVFRIENGLCNILIWHTLRVFTPRVHPLAIKWAEIHRVYVRVVALIGSVDRYSVVLLVCIWEHWQSIFTYYTYQ